MTINPTHIKYIAWRNPEGLHEDTTGCISQLEFINDELDFFNILVKEYTLELIYEDTFEKSKNAVSKLIKLQKELIPLLAQVNIHRNKLKILMDDIDVPNELQDYKTEHYKLMFDAISFYTKYKKLKKELFTLITSSIKQKKLLN